MHIMLYIMYSILYFLSSIFLLIEEKKKRNYKFTVIPHFLEDLKQGARDKSPGLLFGNSPVIQCRAEWEKSVSFPDRW